MDTLEKERKRQRMSSSPAKLDDDNQDGGSSRTSSISGEHDDTREEIMTIAEMELLSTDQKLNMILAKVTSMDLKLSGRLDKVEEKTKVTEEHIVEIREEIDNLKRNVEDHANRLRRNNVIFHGIPEGAEGTNAKNCVNFIQSFMNNHMKIEDAETWEIERAHRSPSGSQHGRTRPIFVKFLRYENRVEVLRQAPEKLKDNEFKFRGQSARIYVSDDVTYIVRQDRKKLTELKKAIKTKFPKRKVFIPPVVPAILLRENSAGGLVRVALGTKLNTLD
ncbi:uncharacterized protein [Amphiura filiformis]|uniref:uncharacterized protein n=1 Tax=Amphiura filiformis TaxID=82378 RepID=UPI003B2102B4